MTQFSEIVGHANVLNALRRVAASKDLPHVMLFCGPEGVGKSMAARAMIAEVMGEKAAHKLREGVHPDVKEYFPESKNEYYSVQQIDHFIGEIAFPPFESDYRFFLFHDAHKLQTVQSNRLLKSLEEMPPYGIAILFSHDEHALLDTITSRAIQFQFHPLKEEEVALALQDKFGHSQEQAQEMARLSEGSMRRALHLEKLSELKEALLGAMTAYAQDQLTRASEKLESVEKIVEEKSEENPGSRVSHFVTALDLMMYWVRDVHLVQNGSDASLLYYPEKHAFFQKLEKRSILSLEKAKSLQNEALESFELNIKARHLLQHFMLQMYSA